MVGMPLLGGNSCVMVEVHGSSRAACTVYKDRTVEKCQIVLSISVVGIFIADC